MGSNPEISFRVGEILESFGILNDVVTVKEVVERNLLKMKINAFSL